MKESIECWFLIVGQVKLLCQHKPFGSWDAFGIGFLGRQHLCTYKLQLQRRKGAESCFVTLSAQRQLSIVQTCNIGRMIELFSPQGEWNKGERREGSTWIENKISHIFLQAQAKRNKALFGHSSIGLFLTQSYRMAGDNVYILHELYRRLSWCFCVLFEAWKL